MKWFEKLVGLIGAGLMNLKLGPFSLFQVPMFSLTGLEIGAIMAGIGTLAGGTAGIIGASRSGGGGGDIPIIWPEWRSAPEYPWTQGLLSDVAGFAGDELARIRRGEYPEYFTNALPTFRENLARPLQRFYEGVPGQRQGALQKMYELGSIAGLGPANVGMQVQKQLFEWGQEERKIDEYLTKLGYDVMQQGAYGIPSMILGMPRGPEGSWVSPFQPAVPQNQTGAMLGNLGGQLLTQGAGWAMNNLFSGTQNQQSYGLPQYGIYGQGSVSQLGSNYQNLLPSGAFLNTNPNIPNPASYNPQAFSGTITNPRGYGDIFGLTGTPYGG